MTVTKSRSLDFSAHTPSNSNTPAPRSAPRHIPIYLENDSVRKISPVFLVTTRSEISLPSQQTISLSAQTEMMETDEKDTLHASTSGRIMDRNIRKGNLSIFSSRLGGEKRYDPPRKVTPEGSSVKDIVKWLESTSTTTEKPSAFPQASEDIQGDCKGLVSRDEDSSSPNPSPPPERAASPDQVAQTAQPSTETEEYSLTLLRYKKYFNNRPLARCLDVAPEPLKGKDELSKETRRKNLRRTSSIQQLEALMSDLSDMSIDKTVPPLPTTEQRDPKDVKEF
ncbi:hypothetical protein UCRPA7_940 [Phaeoacremonium minimum UCRPA7]|uniref:Uncharacterized protein n=1 Tax=Phaeoacremonium minimum (strain UCR-PA7) TaxID=1286976 RepID=R8BVX8_PHAM7|nr:hypothetical protein UCRPA7_940 [Phaeoacremonium minimum UCRPA7]EOO03470.1 hypothetical protein UCRPA7_940 [Phaeoacremonium minimum UCRPA7]